VGAHGWPGHECAGLCGASPRYFSARLAARRVPQRHKHPCVSGRLLQERLRPLRAATRTQSSRRYRSLPRRIVQLLGTCLWDLCRPRRRGPMDPSPLIGPTHWEDPGAPDPASFPRTDTDLPRRRIPRHRGEETGHASDGVCLGGDSKCVNVGSGRGGAIIGRTGRRSSTADLRLRDRPRAAGRLRSRSLCFLERIVRGTRLQVLWASAARDTCTWSTDRIATPSRRSYNPRALRGRHTDKRPSRLLKKQRQGIDRGSRV
jgi:hypothetical protein